MCTSIRYVKIFICQWLYVIKYFNVVLGGVNKKAQNGFVTT